MTDPSPAKAELLWRHGRVALPAVTLLFLAVFAVQFAGERLYSDSGYYLARVINEGIFRIEHGRYVLALSQILPLLGSKVGVPMRGLILLHSLNNVVFLAACMLFAVRVLRNDRAVIALATVHLIGLTHGLFCPIFELYYGVDLLILFHATLHTDRLKPTIRWVLLAVLFVGAVSSHFFAMLLTVGLVAMERIWRDRRTTFVLLALLIVVLVLRFIWVTEYESSRLGTVWFLGDADRMREVVAPMRLLELMRYVARHYADVALLSLAMVVLLGREKKWWELCVFVLGLALLHLMTSLYLPGFLHDRYREQINFACTAWAVLVACHQLLPIVRWRAAVMMLLGAALLFRMACAEWIAPHYVARTAWIEERIARAHDLDVHKAIVTSPVLFGTEDDVVDLSWSTPIESLLLSAREGPDSTVSLITTEDLTFPEVADHLDQFVFRRWDILDHSWLDPRYFNVPEGRYVSLPDPAATIP